jgi:hypothetical protein
MRALGGKSHLHVQTSKEKYMLKTGKINKFRGKTPTSDAKSKDIPNA